MLKLRKTLIYSIAILALAVNFAGSAEAQKRSDKEIRDAVRSLNSKIDDFETNLRYQMQTTSADNAATSQAAGNIRGLRDAVRRFQDNYDRRRENRDDVNAIISAAQQVARFLELYPQNRRVQDDWNGASRQVERLAANYGIVVNWQEQSEVGNPIDYPPGNQPSNYPDNRAQAKTFTVGLSGTYSLDTGRSENVDDIIRDTNLGSVQLADLKEKLVAPEEIALDIRGSQVTLATSSSSPVTFTADGRDKVEQGQNGKTVRMRATLSGDKLVVSSIGGETDYNITFTSLSGGRGMKVSRRITTEYLSQTVFAESVYNKTDSVARLGIDASQGRPDPIVNSPDNTTSANNNRTYDPNGGYSDNDQNGTVANGTSRTNNGGITRPTQNPRNSPYPQASTTRPGNYTVLNGVALTGVLDTPIDSGASQNNDRFRMTVQSPDEYRGAVVEGYLSNVTRSGKVTGQATVTLNFEKITLRGGQTYDFAGYMTDARTLTGKVLRVDNESTIRGSSQTNQTAKRGGIGAGLGALIGAIAGGAKGAAIGAVIGAGGGAGSVYVQGKNDVELEAGSTITVVSTSPNTQDR